MAERGATPQVSPARRRALHAVRSALQPAAAGRLPRTDQPALVDPRAARADRTDRRGDRGHRHRADPPRLRVDWPPARPVPADWRRHRRRAPLARLLAHLGARPPGRVHQHHAEAGRLGQGLALPGPPGQAGRRGQARRCGRDLRPARAAADQAALHQRRQRYHPDHEHAAQPRSRRGGARRGPHPLRPHRKRRDLRRPPARDRRGPSRATACGCGSPASRDASPPATSTSSARTGAGAVPSSRGRARCSTR